MPYPGASTFPSATLFPSADVPTQPNTYVPVTETFRVFAYDINTNTLLNELPVNNLTYDSRLGDAGACSFDLNLRSPAVQKVISPILAYDGAAFALYIDRNGQIDWAGEALTGNYDSVSGVLPVTIGGQNGLQITFANPQSLTGTQTGFAICTP